jgi:hypothetical protein
MLFIFELSHTDLRKFPSTSMDKALVGLWLFWHLHTTIDGQNHPLLLTALQPEKEVLELYIPRTGKISCH